MRILAIDDSQTIRDIVTTTLYDNGFVDVETAVDGLDALNIVNEDEDGFDFFICDINMPNMDGSEFIINLRNKFNYMYTPVMVLTTERSSTMKKKGKEVGATSWMVKPFNAKKFIEGIASTLKFAEDIQENG